MLVNCDRGLGAELGDGLLDHRLGLGDDGVGAADGARGDVARHQASPSCLRVVVGVSAAGGAGRRVLAPPSAASAVGQERPDGGEVRAVAAVAELRGS